ncbi:MAG: zinc ribbon domain-containing protein [Acidobacteria bacterium]|jgi:putative FmdB family regulatory protein|nr:zinc ribbon domain-containing protein [Acidobacteriota bacterium]
MPLFEFSCRDCGHRFETLVMGDRTPVCPHCDSRTLDKQFSTFGMASSGSKARSSAAPRFT